MSQEKTNEVCNFYSFHIIQKKQTKQNKTPVCSWIVSSSWALQHLQDFRKGFQET